MSTKVAQIKELIKNECLTSGKFDPWFYSVHLLAVEKSAKILLKQLPKADKEVVMLGVWLHDLQRIRAIKGDHAKIGAREAKKVMQEFKYPKETIQRVEEIILTHSCDQHMPKTLEGKILASADAMSHFVNDFYLQIAVTGKRDLANYKTWSLEKIERDYRKKIFFPFARKIVSKRYKVLKELFTMK